MTCTNILGWVALRLGAAKHVGSHFRLPLALRGRARPPREGCLALSAALTVGTALWVVGLTRCHGGTPMICAGYRVAIVHCYLPPFPYEGPVNYPSRRHLREAIA